MLVNDKKISTQACDDEAIVKLTKNLGGEGGVLGGVCVCCVVDVHAVVSHMLLFLTCCCFSHVVNLHGAFMLCTTCTTHQHKHNTSPPNPPFLFPLAPTCMCAKSCIRNTRCNSCSATASRSSLVLGVVSLVVVVVPFCVCVRVSESV